MTPAIGGLSVSVKKYLETAPLLELTRYASRDDYAAVSLPYIGAPRKHPYDREKLILITHPFTADPTFYEFKLTDILHAEDLENLVTETGESLPVVRIWIRRGSIGIRFIPFEVDAPGSEERSVVSGTGESGTDRS